MPRWTNLRASNKAFAESMLQFVKKIQTTHSSIILTNPAQEKIMKNATRIPECKSHTFDGMLYWFAEMSVNGLLFHPDDDPSKLTLSANNEPMFNAMEVYELRTTLDRMFAENDDEVYEAAHPVFMKRMGIQLDA